MEIISGVLITRMEIIRVLIRVGDDFNDKRGVVVAVGIAPCRWGQCRRGGGCLGVLFRGVLMC